MPNLHTPESALYLLQAFASAFLAILFLQSGIDKVVDRRGNLEWLQGHFAKSPLAGIVPLLVTIITILEIAAGALSAGGCVVIILTRDSTLAFYGAVIAANRVGKDDGVSFCGTSVIIDPYGVIVAAASADREELICSEISEEVLHSVRDRMTVFAHRRPELYGKHR